MLPGCAMHVLSVKNIEQSSPTFPVPFYFVLLRLTDSVSLDSVESTSYCHKPTLHARAWSTLDLQALQLNMKLSGINWSFVKLDEMKDGHGFTQAGAKVLTSPGGLYGWTVSVRGASDCSANIVADGSAATYWSSSSGQYGTTLVGSTCTNTASLPLTVAPVLYSRAGLCVTIPPKTKQKPISQPKKWMFSRSKKATDELFAHLEANGSMDQITNILRRAQLGELKDAPAPDDPTPGQPAPAPADPAQANPADPAQADPAPDQPDPAPGPAPNDPAPAEPAPRRPIPEIGWTSFEQTARNVEGKRFVQVHTEFILARKKVRDYAMKH
eukprot:g2374.t1